MASVTFENVVKRYGNVTAVSNPNLEIPDKEFLVFVGPSVAAIPPACACWPAWKTSAKAPSSSAIAPSTMCRPGIATSPWCSSPTRSTRT